MSSKALTKELKERQANCDRLQLVIAALEADRAEMEYNSLANRLERNRVALQDARQTLFDENRQIKNIVGNHVKALPRYVELTAGIRENADKEFARVRDLGGGGISQKYIRADAREYFGREAREAEKKLASMLERWPEWPRIPGPRLIEERGYLQGIINGWEQTEKHCKTGEEVFALREARKAMEAERRQLEVDAIENPEALAV